MSRFTAVRTRLRAVRQDPRSGVLAVLACGWGLSIGVRLVYPALLPHLRAWYGLDLTTAGLLVSVLWGVYAVGQLPGGLLADRFGERFTLAASLVLSGACLGVVALAPSLVAVFVGTGLFGLATALYAVPRLTVLADLYPARLGSAIGVSMAAGDVGNTALPPVAAAVTALLWWQAGFAVWIPVLLLLGVVLWRVVPDGDRPRRARLLSRGTLRAIAGELRRRVIVQLFVIVVLTEVTWHAFTAFYPLYLVEVKGLSPTAAAVLFGAFFAAGSVMKLLAGGGYDRVGIRGSLPAVLGVACAGLVVLPFVEAVWALVALTVAISSFLGSYTVTLAFLTVTLADEIQGTGLGLLRTVYIMIGAASPVGMGMLADRGYFDEAFWAIAAILLLAIALTVVLPAAGRSR